MNVFYTRHNGTAENVTTTGLGILNPTSVFRSKGPHSVLSILLILIVCISRCERTPGHADFGKCIVSTPDKSALKPGGGSNTEKKTVRFKTK